MDVPVHIGFSILQYAKLRMLEFYFDFMLRYVSLSRVVVFFCLLGSLTRAAFNTCVFFCYLSYQLS